MAEKRSTCFPSALLVSSAPRAPSSNGPILDALMAGFATRWVDCIPGAQIVSGEGQGDSSDSDFEPNYDSIVPNSSLSSRWFRSLSSGRLMKLLAEILPVLEPCPEETFSWTSICDGVCADKFPYHPHFLLIRGGSFGPVSDQVSLFLDSKWESLPAMQVLLSRRVKGGLRMQVLDFWQLDRVEKRWIHRGTVRYLVTGNNRWEELELQLTHT